MDELVLLAIKADDEGLLAGEEPKQRAFKNVIRILQDLGVEGVPLTGKMSPEIVKRVHRANQRLFRPVDMQEGGVHLGLFMYRDLFASLYVPYILGSPEVDFWKLLDFSDDQKRWVASDSNALATFEDQCLDLLDFGYGYMEFGHTRPVNDYAKELIYRAHVQLESAAATATAAFDYRGTLQGALLGTELALKAGLAANGHDEESLRTNFGHNLTKAAKKLGNLEPNFDADRVESVVSDFPDFVQSRYSGQLPTRKEIGHIVMKAQFVASEVTRQFTDRNIRSQQSRAATRSYP
ncbi:hypothetical protein P7228_02165 [Altererythrobacter arenosus]|uniref:HEPN domain-containing protein n=1 Tax=Altererythrobacter arenosus TaxID=3032592 RepID=A0ABY8FST3_9SPHN|nr:hypothetical protein [Altererythrobacter sp. CAU 1644]WFL77897.1 hypothetical protein P7228_02165 [Altererythrobacter sp. CAU 1644]